MDVVNLTGQLVQANVAYLAISVLILLALATAFTYFNFNPIKDKLEKQEGKIDKLKEEANALLEQARDEVSSSIDSFKLENEKSLSKTLENELEKQALEVDNKIRIIDKALSEKMQKHQVELSIISKDVQKQAHVASSEHGKAMSLACTQGGDFSGAFFWKVYEAYWYYIGNLTDHTNYIPTLLLEAIGLLGKVPDGKFDYNDEHIDFLQGFLNSLKDVSEKDTKKILSILDLKVMKVKK